MSDFLISFFIDKLIKTILVLINEFIKNDNKKSQMLNSINHIKQKKVHYYYSQVYSQFDTRNQNAQYTSVL